MVVPIEKSIIYILFDIWVPLHMGCGHRRVRVSEKFVFFIYQALRTAVNLLALMSASDSSFEEAVNDAPLAPGGGARSQSATLDFFTLDIININCTFIITSIPITIHKCILNQDDTRFGRA